MRRVGVCLLLIAFAGCDGHITYSGYVVDGDGNPIADAEVSVMQDGSGLGLDPTSTTGSDGSFFVGGTDAPSGTPVDFRVHKPGFKDDVRRLPAESDHELRVVMERDPDSDDEFP